MNALSPSVPLFSVPRAALMEPKRPGRPRAERAEVLYLASILGTALAIQVAGSWGPPPLAANSSPDTPVWAAVEAMMGGAQSKPKQQRSGKTKPSKESSLKSSIENPEGKSANEDQAVPPVPQAGSEPVKGGASTKDNLEAEKEARESAPDAPGKSGVDLMQAAINLEKKKQYPEALETYKIALKKGSHTDSKKIQAAGSQRHGPSQR